MRYACDARCATRGRAALLALSCLLLLVGCSGEGAANKLLEQANTQVDAGEIEQAVALLERIEAEHPTTQAARQARELVDFYRNLARAEDLFPHRQTRDKMIQVGRAVFLYQERRGRFPAALEDLVPRHLDAAPVDSWGQPLIYTRTRNGRGYLIASLGGDLAPGGSGADADLFLEDGRFTDAPKVPLP